MSASVREITLKSSDGETFDVNEEVALKSQTIKHIIDDCGDSCILLPNVTGKILAKVIEYCKKHVEAASSDDLKAWDDEFVKLDHTTLFALIIAANYLNIQSLLELTCQAVANMIQEGKTVEEIREMFNITNDYTPEEEAEIRKETQWAFE